MYAQQLLVGCLRVIDASQYIKEPGRDKLILNCGKPAGILGMVFAGIVQMGLVIGFPGAFRVLAPLFAGYTLLILYLTA